MLTRATSFVLDGLEPRRVLVEVDVRPGLPAFSIVGLGDAAVRESRERVRAAILNSGFEFPLRRVTANLAPAHLRKTGPGFDLALAAALLGATGALPAGALARWALTGELSLGGEVRSCRGAIVAAEGARRAGLGLAVPEANAAEAALVDGVPVAPLRDLRDLAALLTDGEVRPLPPPRAAAPAPAPDLADVRGHATPRRALEVAAAGGHNLLLEGPPGTGKTMLAARLPGLLPPLAPDEALEVARIRSVAGLGGEGLGGQRPFRAPHHTISASGLTGGGAVPGPGEATLAHHGVLFLDELSEFGRPTLEALRQPLEDGHVLVVRGQRAVRYPTGFLLVAATNPCPCGHAGTERCTCSPVDHARHARRLSGPLLDRIDAVVAVERPPGEALLGPPGEASAAVRERVLAARERARHRFREHPGVRCNAHMGPALARRHVHLDARAARLLTAAYDREGLSARGHHRVLRVALTLADLAGRDDVRAEDVATALHFRRRDGRAHDVLAA